jgi:RNA polymerase sigma-70 factor, ECF subfamily
MRSGWFVSWLLLLCAAAAAEDRFMKASCSTSTNKHSDEVLVATTKRGDAHAFEELVLRHRQKVVAIAQRITRNREDAEDVAQESFHKAFLHLDAFQEKSQFSTWLTRIAMNEAFMLLRRWRGIVEVLPENPDDGMKSSSETFVDQSPNPEQSFWQRECTDLLTEAIDRLNPRIGRTIFLRDIEERSVKETAQILGTSISAVKARHFQGRRKLRRSLNPGFPRELSGSREAQRY